MAYFSPQDSVVLSGSNVGRYGTIEPAGTDLTEVTDAAGGTLAGTGLMVSTALAEVEMVG